MFDDNDIQKLIEVQEEIFVTKEDMENLIDIVATKEDVKNFAMKNNLIKFKDEILTGHDMILTKLDILLAKNQLKTRKTRNRKKFWKFTTLF